MNEADGSTKQYTFSKPDPNAAKWPPTGVKTSFSDKLVMQEFDDLQAAVNASKFSATVNRNIWAGIDRGDSNSAKDSYGWYGVEGGPMAVRRIIDSGWPEGVRMMNEALADIGVTARPRAIRRVRRWTDQGDSVDMSRVWAGRVDTAWQRCHRQVRIGRQNVTIAANITALGKARGRDLFWRGAAVLKLSDLLSEAGYNVEIVGIRYTHGAYDNGRSILQRVRLKPALAPLDLNALAATVCLSGFFRTVLFKCQCVSGFKVYHGMGQSGRYVGDEGEITGVENCMSSETARRWIEAQIEKLEQQ